MPFLRLEALLLMSPARARRLCSPWSLGATCGRSGGRADARRGRGSQLRDEAYVRTVLRPPPSTQNPAAAGHDGRIALVGVVELGRRWIT